MGQAALTPGYAALADGDPGWLTFEGDVRVRTVSGVVQIQVSTDNGDGTFDIATLQLQGGLRDVRKGSLTQWPSYNDQGLPTNFLTDAQRRQRQIDRANANDEITTPGPLAAPVSGSNTGN